VSQGRTKKSALYVGTVMHARRSPRENVFRYPVYMALIDLDELPLLDRTLPLFGWNRRAVTSFHDADHIDIHAVLALNEVELGAGGSIQVLTNLRVLGYVFNPVSFWWCRRGDGSLACIVAEVNNTFGERLPYVLLPAGDRGAEERAVFETEKRLHVSPFMPMDQSYTWWFSDPGQRLSVRMDVHEADSRDFHATLTASRRPLTGASLRSVLVRYPMMPLRVISLIHWQALRLWVKRMRFYRKPPFIPGHGSVRPGSAKPDSVKR
jgi:DUF1365 family protein